MQKQTKRTFRVYSEGNWPVSSLSQFLRNINSAYNGILIVEATLNIYNEQSEYQRNQRREFYYQPEIQQLQAFFLMGPDGTFQQLIDPHDHLILSQARLSSPGFLEFLGALNPLEVIRRFFDDYHRRRQDKNYREAHESRSMDLQNQLLENEVIRERIEIARSNGISEEILTALVNRWIQVPLLNIEPELHRGIISTKPDEAD